MHNNMSKQYKVLVVAKLLIFALCGNIALASVPSLKPPKITLHDVSLDRFALDAAYVFVDLRVLNPNDKDVVVESVRYHLTLNDTRVKSDRIQQKERFPALTERAVRVPVALAYNEHLTNILTVIRNPKSSTYEIKGFVKIKGKDEEYPFSHKGAIVLPGMGALTGPS